jgi:Gas vesicle protein
MSNSFQQSLNTTKSPRPMTHSTQGSSLADILERVLDKGIVIAGDVSISIADTELIHIRIRLLISSVDKAREMGINWWENDSFLSSHAAKLEKEADILRESNLQLQQRLDSMENELKLLRNRLTSDTEKLNKE